MPQLSKKTDSRVRYLHSKGMIFNCALRLVKISHLFVTNIPYMMKIKFLGVLAAFGSKLPELYRGGRTVLDQLNLLAAAPRRRLSDRCARDAGSGCFCYLQYCLGSLD